MVKDNKSSINAIEMLSLGLMQTVLLYTKAPINPGTISTKKN